MNKYVNLEKILELSEYKRNKNMKKSKRKINDQNETEDKL
jgi:hypothetical protein